MRIVIQRVKRASVTIDGSVHSSIGAGLMVLVGVEKEDTSDDAIWLASKTAGLRIFNDDDGVMNRSIADAGGKILAVSQFTLTASTRKGNRPSYIRAAGHDTAVPPIRALLRRDSTPARSPHPARSIRRRHAGRACQRRPCNNHNRL